MGAIERNMSNNQARTRSTGTEYGQRPPHGHAQNVVSIPDDDLLELLGDEYTQEVLDAVIDQPRSGRAVAEATTVSKPTAFRRLNRLEEAGLVRSKLCIDGDGHHHDEYRAVVTDVSVELCSEGLSVEVSVEQPATDVPASRPAPADD
jgi:DNA-binding transcriptional ArsR family regulator